MTSGTVTGKPTRYGYERTVRAPFTAAVARVRTALQREGLGVLFEADLKAKLHEKLGVDFQNYVILGACDPATAFEALQVEQDLGLLLPCNVVVYEHSDGQVTASAVNAGRLLDVTGNRHLAAAAERVNLKLRRAVDAF